jgi:hypothetical protein
MFSISALQAKNYGYRKAGAVHLARTCEMRESDASVFCGHAAH